MGGRVALSKIEQGKKAKIVQILDEQIRKRVEHLGIRVGKELLKVSTSPMKGAVTVQINNTQVAIGFGAAEKIIVEEVEFLNK
jgi:ferrous iron transport protein A